MPKWTNATRLLYQKFTLSFYIACALVSDRSPVAGILVDFDVVAVNLSIDVSEFFDEPFVDGDCGDSFVNPLPSSLQFLGMRCRMALHQAAVLKQPVVVGVQSRVAGDFGMIGGSRRWLVGSVA